MAATKVDIPTLGESVTEAVLVKWLKPDGASVAIDDPLCELETDKANVELPSPAAGVLRHKVKQGTTVRIGDAVAEVEAGGVGATKAAAAPAKTAATPPPRQSRRRIFPGSRPRGIGSRGFKPFRASARQRTQCRPVDLQGTGPRGRIVKEDVMAMMDSAKPTPSFAKAPPPPPPAASRAYSGEGEHREPMTKIRKKIAERLVQAQHNAAMLTTFNEVDMTEVLGLRERYKDQFQKTYGVSLGLMSFFARAVALALKEFPVVNAFIEGEDVVLPRPCESRDCR